MRYGLMLLCFVSFSLYALDPDTNQQQIKDRIQPVGNVHIQVEKIALAESEKQNIAPVKINQGQIIYEQHCMVCHTDGIAGAPKFRNSTDWKARLMGKKLNDLVVSATKGLNAMPAKGTCFDCSDADLKAAIQYMLAK
jgi:cytochrome c5